MNSETLQRRRPNSASHNNNALIREKRLKRSEVLAKKKTVEELIKAAHAEKDHLASYPAYRHFHINGLSVCLKSGHGNKLSSTVKHYIQSLLKLNMEGPYGSEWPEEEKVKRREMVAPEACYIFVHEVANSNADEMTTVLTAEDSGPLVGFVHYRFVLEEEVPVLYVYELQLEPRVRGKGLGKFLMELIELMAQKNCMGAVMLTVQKANLLAMSFYISKLRYIISTMSPSKVNPMMEKSYEILCKTFNDEAKTILEVSRFFIIKHSAPNFIKRLPLEDACLNQSGFKILVDANGTIPSPNALSSEAPICLLLANGTFNTILPLSES